MLGQSGAIAKRPPQALNSLRPMMVFKTAIGAVSAGDETLPTASGGTGIPFGGCWVSFTASVDCWIHFYRRDATVFVEASSANSYPLMAGVEYNWWCNDTEDFYFRIVRAGAADGLLTRYRSNL